MSLVPALQRVRSVPRSAATSDQARTVERTRGVVLVQAIPACR